MNFIGQLMIKRALNQRKFKLLLLTIYIFFKTSPNLIKIKQDLKKLSKIENPSLKH